MLEYLKLKKILAKKAILKYRQGFCDQTESLQTSFGSHHMKRFICLKVQKFEQSNKVQF